MARASSPAAAPRPAPRPNARPATPRTPAWVWLGLILVTGAIGGVGYWAFYLPFQAR